MRIEFQKAMGSALHAIFLSAGLCMSMGAHAAAGVLAPSDYFDLSHWKLQYPGSVEAPTPREIKPKDIADYASEFFAVDPWTQDMVFTLDADAPSSTTNSPFVHCELREEIVANDDTTNVSALKGKHALDVTLKVGKNTLTEKITVVQMHGGQKGGFTLFQVVFEDKKLVSYFKRDNTRDKELRVPIGDGYYADYTHFNVQAISGRLIVRVNEVEKLNVDVSYWNWPTYFKTGACPQTNMPGKVSVHIRTVKATHAL